MSQSTVIFGSIILGWIVFITVKGELPLYLSIVGLAKSSTASST